MAITLNLTTGHKVTTIDSNQNKDKTFADVFNSYDADKNNALSSEELANMLGDNVKITKEGINAVKEKYKAMIENLKFLFEKLGDEKTECMISLMKDVIQIYKENVEGELQQCLD